MRLRCTMDDKGILWHNSLIKATPIVYIPKDCNFLNVPIGHLALTRSFVTISRVCRGLSVFILTRLFELLLLSLIVYARQNTNSITEFPSFDPKKDEVILSTCESTYQKTSLEEITSLIPSSNVSNPFFCLHVWSQHWNKTLPLKSSRVDCSRNWDDLHCLGHLNTKIAIKLSYNSMFHWTFRRKEHLNYSTSWKSFAIFFKHYLFPSMKSLSRIVKWTI